ncbi:MAG: NCS2 family permease [Leptospiraceae bacterium]|nr:NCS2 family permease [Leptospiraceae bacterium]
MLQAMQALLKNWFDLEAKGTTIRTELGSGLTTFLTMSYILAVNPLILSAAGMEKEAVFFATAVSAGITSILMGLFVNVPVALAPGMGLNAYFVSVVLGSDGQISYQMALAAVFLSGLIFLLLTLTKIRPLLVEAFPESLKIGIGAGIGLFLVFIGFKGSGILSVLAQQSAESGAILENWAVQPGSLQQASVYLGLLGLLLVGVGSVLRWNFSILVTIAILTFLSVLVGETAVPDAANFWKPRFSTAHVLALDIPGALELGLLSIVFTFTFVELFDSFGTLVATLRKAGIRGEEEKRVIGKAMIVDATGISLGALLGTSTVTAYIESASGIASGGRSGLSAITTGILFVGSLLFSGLILLVPASATAPVLIFVGMLMLTSLSRLSFNRPEDWIPALLTVLFMPFTYNIASGIAVGVLSYVILASVAGRIREIHWLLWVVAGLIVLRYSAGGMH